MFNYIVSVKSAPRKMPGDGWKVNLDHLDWYNVYEAGAARSSLPVGQTRGFWKNDRWGTGPPPVFTKYSGSPVQVVPPVSQPFFGDGPSPMD